MRAGEQDRSILVRLRCGTRVVMRPITPDDAARLVEGLSRLSMASRRRRFFFDKQRYTEDELRRFTDTNEERHVALAAAIADETGRELQPVAVARCFRSETNPELAEVAFATIDEWQRRGIGTVLIATLAERAWHAGIRRWRAVFTPDNIAARRLLDHVGTIESRDVGPDYAEVVCTLSPATANAGEV